MILKNNNHKPYSKYKSSGIEWIGDIPESWEVKKLKYVVKDKLKYGANEIAELDDINLPRYIRITDFDANGNLRRDTFKSLPNEVAKNYLLEKGDILFARSGATVGKTFHYKNNEGKTCFAGYLIKATPNKSIILSDYLYFFTKSQYYDTWKSSIFIQATIQNIGANKYSELNIPISPLSEQRTIANYLDRQTSLIDEAISKSKGLIETLREKRTALISAVVTGKIDVRDCF